MGKITTELLGKIAPGTKPDSVRDRFLPFLNEACPRYGITTELRVAAFLATICFESNYFRATKEGRARSGSKVRAVQDRYWGTGFFGRGLIQTTHRKNYVLFSQAMFKAGVTDSEFLFVEQPELLEQPKWAVESACYFWQSNHLNTYADKGKFFAIQGLTNRGNATKEAWGYDDRLKLYETALRHMPDDFSLNSAATSMPAPLTTANDKQDTLVPDPADSQAGQPEPPPTVIAGATDTAVSTQTTTTETTGTPPGDTVQTTTTTNEAPPVAVTPAKPTLQATAIAFLTMLYGWYKMAKEDFGNLVDRATDAIDLHMAINLGVGLSLVILGVWMHQRSRQRAAEITQSLIATAADQQSNTVTLVSRSHWWSKWF